MGHAQRRLTVRVQLNNTHDHVRVCTVLVTHGNVGRALCLRADVQRLNVTNTYGVRPQLMHSRQPQLLAETVGGRSAQTRHDTRQQAQRVSQAQRGKELDP